MQKSLRQDLSIRIGLVILIISIIIGIAFYFFSINLSEKEFNKYIEHRTENIANTFTLQLWLFDLNTTRELCKLILDEPGVSGLQLLDHRKETIFDQRTEKSKLSTRISRELRYEGEKLVGYVDIYFSNTSWIRQRHNILTIMILLILGTMLGSFLFINILLKKHLSKPLKDLQENMYSLSKGDFHRSDLVGEKTEIQDIINTFNSLILSLQQRDEEILKKTDALTTEMSERKKMENELFQAHKMEAVGTLAGGIAHDFNNILAVILGYAEIIKDDLDDGTHTKKDIDRILIAANRAKELVKQILTFSRKGQETNEPLQPTPVIEEALKLIHASMPTTIEIQEKIDQNCGTILANQTHLHQILVNLCTNALHAMEDEKGVLTVELNKVYLKNYDIRLGVDVSEGEFVELNVGDTGCGMNTKTIEHIFDPFFTTKDVGKGTGMGLAMVHGIVQACGGFIKVNSEPDKGSMFQVYFPIIDKIIVKEEKEQNGIIKSNNERILIVDDEEVIGNMYRIALERLGYSIIVHHNSQKALEVFMNSPDHFDLIITDQTMPHLSGSDLAKKILQIRQEIPIILCTGYSTMISEEKAKEIGIAKFVIKPVNIKELALTVQELLA